MAARLKILDFLLALAAFAYGVWSLWMQWPSPDWLAWTAFALGVMGMPLAFLDPLGRVRRMTVRRMVKKRA